MGNIGIAGIVIIVVNVLFSYIGFKDEPFFNSYLFNIGKILVHKEYKRFFTSGFLHLNWQHLIFNMLTLYFFADNIENLYGLVQFLIIYFAALAGGNLFALYIHRNNSDYRAVGASGAVSGIIFASIALFPGLAINPFMIPIDIPAWIFGLAYVLYSIYGMRSKRGNIGHEAHLGGGLIGMIAAIIMNPAVLSTNYLAILLIIIPSVVFIFFIILKPEILMLKPNPEKKKELLTIDDEYNINKKNNEQEVDEILDKINRNGMKSLSKLEKKLLKEYSEKLNR